MKCPICNVELKMTDRQGVEIDYCPQCRGVWLDRGELDKIIERSAQEMFRSPQGSELSSHHGQSKDWDDDRSQAGQKPKRKSFLGDMFDIFD